MAEDRTYIDIKSLDSTKEMLVSECNELINMIDIYKEMFEETKKIYDTESATLFRKIASFYLNYIEKYINEEFKPLINNLDDIKQAYMELDSSLTIQDEGGTK